MSAAGGRWGSPGTRLLTDVAPASEPGLDAVVGPLAAGGGTVWVSSPDPTGWEHRLSTEHATATFRS
jgi:hypothetical protein